MFFISASPYSKINRAAFQTKMPAVRLGAAAGGKEREMGETGSPLTPCEDALWGFRGPPASCSPAIIVTLLLAGNRGERSPGYSFIEFVVIIGASSGRQIFLEGAWGEGQRRGGG